MSPISLLPDETWALCFSFLPPADLARAGLVCSRWHSISQDSILWKNICRQRFKEMAFPNANPLEGWKEFCKSKVVCPYNIKDISFTPKLTTVTFSWHDACASIFIVNGILIAGNKSCTMFFLKNLSDGQEVYLEGIPHTSDLFEFRQTDSKLFIRRMDQVFVIDCAKKRIEDIALVELWQSQNLDAFDVDDDTLVLATNNSLEIVDMHSKEVQNIPCAFDTLTSVNLSKKYILVESKIYIVFDRTGALIAEYDGHLVHFAKNDDSYVFERDSLFSYNPEIKQSPTVYQSKHVIDEAYHHTQDSFLLFSGRSDPSILTLVNTKNGEANEITLDFTLSIQVCGNFVIYNHLIPTSFECESTVFLDINTQQTARKFQKKRYDFFNGRFLVAKSENCLEIWDFFIPAEPSPDFAEWTRLNRNKQRTKSKQNTSIRDGGTI